MAFDSDANLMIQRETSFASQPSPSPAIPLSTQTHTRAFAGSDVRLDIDFNRPECETEYTDSSDSLFDGRSWNPPQELKNCNDVHRSTIASRKMTWSSSATVIPSGRGRSSIVIITEGFLQIATSAIILGLAATVLKSPTQPVLTEWEACDYLGIFASVWVIRMCVICGLSYWGFLHDRLRLDQQHSEDLRLLTNLALTGPCTLILQLKNHTTSEPHPPPYDRFYSRLLRFLTGLSVVWWFGANILEYRSSSTCRRSSPHIWGLVLGILMISYLFILSTIAVLVISLIRHVRCRVIRSYK